MKVKLLLFASVFVLLGCNNQSNKTNAQDCEVNYETYYNQRYDYGVAYPDFLIPQGESESQDGQMFVSDKGKMVVYRTFKAIVGDNPTIEAAFEEELKASENIKEKLLSGNYYFIKGEKDKNTLYNQYTILANDDFFVIYFEYQADDERLFECISNHVSESFNVGTSADVESNKFILFLGDFLNECFWDVNFNALLRDNDERLRKYIDSQMDIRRYYNPGAIVYLYTRADNFGFGDFNDFDTKLESGGEYSLKKLSNDTSPCELDFNHGKGYPEIYYCEASKVPDELVDSETFEFRPVTLPYSDATIMVAYLPEYYRGNVNARAFYFIETPSGWKLAFVDDSLCSA